MLEMFFRFSAYFNTYFFAIL